MKRARALLLLGIFGAACGRTELFADFAKVEPTTLCGDGQVDDGELCDDGNVDPSDDCLGTCVLARCGDGVLHKSVEVCDDGNIVDGDGCTSLCGPTSCGDGAVQAPEGCDDGNPIDTDTCLTSCLPAFCGDGFVRTGAEPCDDGNTRNDDTCLVGCMLARRGDGFVHRRVEACDDGNGIDDDACDNGCALPVCGDGVREGSEACDLGAGNGDRPAFLVTQSNLRVGTNALVRAGTIGEFYGYRSASSHTGLENLEESRVYLYLSSTTGRLSLVITHGIDFDGTGVEQPESRVDMEIVGLPFGALVELADDQPSELFMNGATSAAGRWRFQANSDGGAIGGIPFPGTWTITILPDFARGISSWRFVLDDGSGIPLRLEEPVTIEAFDSRSSCRLDCTIPRCGDGTLDGGEVCDDGNTVDQDRCGADCLTIRP